MARKSIFKSLMDQNEAYTETVNVYRNKYYNLYRAQVTFDGINYRQEDYIMKKFYGDGKIAAFKINALDELGFCPFTVATYDMYDCPETVNLINNRGVPFIPATIQTVDKDVCLGYAQRNKKPIKMIVDWYVERIAQVEMVINTNLQMHKMPFLIPVDDDEAKVEDAIRRILNNELVLFVKGVDPKLLTAVSTQAPYIIDKLVEYKVGLENELKTYLSIDNSGALMKREQVNLDEVNANNDEIMDNQESFLSCLEDWCENIEKVLGIKITVKPTSAPVTSIGEVHEGNKPGPKEGNEGDPAPVDTGKKEGKKDDE